MRDYLWFLNAAMVGWLAGSFWCAFSPLSYARRMTRRLGFIAGWAAATRGEHDNIVDALAAEKKKDGDL